MSKTYLKPLSPYGQTDRLVALLIPPSVSPSVASIRYRLFWYVISKKKVVSNGSKEGGERRRMREVRREGGREEGWMKGRQEFEYMCEHVTVGLLSLFLVADTRF